MMNEQLQTQLATVIGALLGAIQRAGDFVLSELPEVATSYVLYGRVLGIVWLLGTGLLGVLLVWSAHKLFKRSGELHREYLKDPHEHADGFFTGMVGVFASIGSLVAWGNFFCAIQPTLLVWLAPKMWLIKQLAGMLK